MLLAVNFAAERDPPGPTSPSHHLNLTQGIELGKVLDDPQGLAPIRDQEDALKATIGVGVGWEPAWWVLWVVGVMRALSDVGVMWALSVVVGRCCEENRYAQVRGMLSCKACCEGVCGCEQTLAKSVTPNLS
jgi:hypothetical protein